MVEFSSKLLIILAFDVDVLLLLVVFLVKIIAYNFFNGDLWHNFEKLHLFKTTFYIYANSTTL